MRHLRMVGLSLVAVFAIAAVTATSASALPEWGKCEAKAGGKYTNANCTTKGKGGSFEWKKGATLPDVHFNGANVGSGGVLGTRFRFCMDASEEHVIENSRTTPSGCTAKGGHIRGGPADSDPEWNEEFLVECEQENSSGKQSGQKSITNIQVRFEGCKLFGSLPCSNAAPGEILVQELKGTLGYINKGAKEVGVLLEPVKKHGVFASFNCSGITVVTVGVGNSKEGAFYTPESKGGYDGIVSPITPVNTMTSKFTQVYTINHETDENVPSKFEGKHISLLEDYSNPTSSPSQGTMWSPAGEEITNLNTAAEPGEIKA